MNAKVTCETCGHVVREEGSSEEAIINDVNELLMIAESLMTFKEGTSNYRKAEDRFTVIRQKYRNDE